MSARAGQSFLNAPPPSRMPSPARTTYYFQSAIDFLGTSIGMATLLTLIGAGLIVATALTVVRVNNTNTSTNDAQALCLSVLNNQQQVLLSGCSSAPDCNFCDDGNPCTYDYYTPGLGICENRRRFNGAPCQSACNKNLLGQTCQEGECVGECPGYCLNATTDCPPINQSALALDIGTLNVSVVCNAKQCQYRFIDFGIPGDLHQVDGTEFFPLPGIIGWPTDAEPQICLSLVDPDSARCLTSRYFYADRIYAADTVSDVTFGWANNIFVCLFVFSCSEPVF
jgi:hypothetical protein